MKKVLGIMIPLAIILIIGGLLALSYSTGGKGIGCDPKSEQGVQAGEKDSQLFIDAFERYKSIHGKYPRTLEALGKIELKSYSNSNITGISPYFASDEYYRVIFTFKPDFICPIPFGQARECTYYSETKQWRCD